MYMKIWEKILTANSSYQLT